MVLKTGSCFGRKTGPSPQPWGGTHGEGKRRGEVVDVWMLLFPSLARQVVALRRVPPAPGSCSCIQQKSFPSLNSLKGEKVKIMNSYFQICVADISVRGKLTNGIQFIVNTCMLTLQNKYML